MFKLADRSNSVIAELTTVDKSHRRGNLLQNSQNLKAPVNSVSVGANSDVPFYLSLQVCNNCFAPNRAASGLVDTKKGTR